MKDANVIRAEDNKQTVVIAYHANCIDGFTAAWAVWYYYTNVQFLSRKDIIAVPVTYQTVPSELDKILKEQREQQGVTSLYIVDFSYPREYLVSLLDENPKLNICMFDHHRSAMEMYTGDPDQVYWSETAKGLDIKINQSESGASLVWKVLLSAEFVPLFVQHVKDYDLWQFKFTHTKALNTVLRTTEFTFENWTRLYEAFGNEDSNYISLVNEGLAMLAYHAYIVKELCKHSEPITLAGEYGLVVNCSPQFASDVGHALAIQSGTFGATWYQESGEVKFSLRSSGYYDVSTIAKNFGGGGHKNAAGFKLASPTQELFPDSDSETGVTLWTS